MVTHTNKYYTRLLNNARKAKQNSTDNWFKQYWENVENKLFVAMSEKGILKQSSHVH